MNTDLYLWIKSLHLIFVISWMVGMLYLPRLYAYHTEVATGSDTDKLFQRMEFRLLRFIMTPAMILTIIFGFTLVMLVGMENLGHWFHAKIFLVFCMAGMHGMLAKWRKDFVNGTNQRSAKFYKIINEVPALIMVAIVILVIVKPF